MSNNILVTGTSTGLGLETAVYLAEQGFEVYASMRDLEGRAALDEEAARRKVSLHLLQLDITDKDDIEQAVRTIVKQSGGIYGLVNNGGIGLRGYFEDLSEEEIHQIFKVNVFGTMEMTRAVLPHMRAARRGRIVIISSIAGLIGALALSSYCATKFAQEGFGESLAQEVMPFGIYVSLVEPAIIKNERWGVNRNIAKRALDPASPYNAWFREAESLADRLVDTSPTKAADVVRAVHRALTVRRPRLRYMVGYRAGLVVALRRYLPRDFFDQLYFGTIVRKVTKAGLPAR
jgi:NAD(P)-dependent dehydrogenase (short-subunit alcohol dehydrogenase family)